MPEPQLPTSCPRCLSRLVADRDIPAAHCGWEDYGEMETGVSSLLGSPLCQNWPAGDSASDTGGAVAAGGRSD